MPANTQPLLNASGNKPAPQYFNPTTDKYEAVHGEDGGSKVVVAGSSKISHGVVDVATKGTAVRLANAACREVTIIAKDTNTGAIFVGGTGVSATSYGVKLGPDSAITLPVANANLLYIDAEVAGEGISFIAL